MASKVKSESSATSRNKETTLSQFTSRDVLLATGQNLVTHPQAEQNSLNNTVQRDTISDIRYAVPQTSTLAQQSSIDYIYDFQISAFMRRQTIDFFSYSLRSNRRVFPFFSDIDVTKIVQTPNVIEVDNNATFLSIMPKTTAKLTHLNNIRPVVANSHELIAITGATTSADVSGGQLLLTRNGGYIVGSNFSIDSWPDVQMPSRAVYAESTEATSATLRDLLLTVDSSANTTNVLQTIILNNPNVAFGSANANTIGTQIVSGNISIANLKSLITNPILISKDGPRVLPMPVAGEIRGQVDTSAEEITIGGGRARVYFTESTQYGTTRLYISEIRRASGANVVSVGYGNTIIGLKSGSQANVVTYQHRSGILRYNSVRYSNADVAVSNTDNNLFGFANTSGLLDYVVLSPDASNTNGYYVGNTFTILNGMIPGETVKIESYDGTTKVAKVSPAIEGLGNMRSTSHIYYSIGDSRVPYNAGSPDVGHYTTSKGFFGGTIHIPGPAISSVYRFRTGQKLFKITDDSNNGPDDTTVAEYVFNSNGLDISKGQIIINNPNANMVMSRKPTTGSFNAVAPALNPPANPTDPIIPGTFTTNSANPIRLIAPLAQSFFVSDIDYPRGIFVPYIDLFFANRGSLPIELQIRPLTNGYPDPSVIVPGAVAVVQSEEVNVSSVPDVNDPTTYTRFTFNAPVQLLPGVDYAIVISGNDYGYDVYTSELGSKILGSDRSVSQQPYLGSLFRSQNSVTYDALENEDLMFVIHKCEFVSRGSVIFYEQKDDNWTDVQFQTLMEANSVFDTFTIHSDTVAIPGTKVDYTYRATTFSNNTLDSTYTEFKPDALTLMTSRKKFNGQQYPDVSFKMQLDLNTDSKDVSPVVYAEKQHMVTSYTLINDMGINPDRIIITNPGQGYTSPNTSVTFTGYTGAGANAMVAISANSQAFWEGSGQIEAIGLDSFGRNYFDNVECTITSTDGTGAEVIVTSETGKSGGPAECRYISKTVTLAPEFDAGDLRVFLTAIKPLEGNIQVYYKVKNNYDTTSIDDYFWVRMEEKTNPDGSFLYSVGANPVELEYRPPMSGNTIVYATDNAIYDTFNQFKIKIVLTSSDTVLTKIPYVYDMRAIALPGTD